MKRLFDLAVAVPLLVVLSPVWAALSAIIKVADHGPALYRAPRIGRHGRGFTMLKFRTMVLDADRLGGASTSAHDPRITPAGQFMRRWKLDEIPQLWNVVRGDMSLVGPRPTLDWDVARYTPAERRLLDVRPGITDWASIEFRDEGAILKNEPDPDEAYDRLIRPKKIMLGLHYVEHSSLREDFRILIETTKAVLGFRPRVPSIDGSDLPPFHRITEGWATTADAQQWELSRQRYSLTAALAHKKDLLEVGCGTGYGLARCREFTRSAVGLEINERNLEIARQRVKDCAFVRGSAESLPFADKSFDVVVGLEMFYYVADQRAFLSEVARVLRPGGTLMLSMPNPDRRAFQASPMSSSYVTADELVRALETVGFTPSLYGSLPAEASGSPARELARRVLVGLRLVPRSIEGRARMKRLVSRNVRPLASIEVDPSRGYDGLTRLSSAAEAADYTILIGIGTHP